MSPISTSGTDCFSLGTTFTNTVAVLFVIVCVTIISAFPNVFPVIVPSLLTVAISSFNDLNVILPASTLSSIKLNLLSNDAVTFVDESCSTFTTFELTFTYVSPITVYTFLLL